MIDLDDIDKRIVTTLQAEGRLPMVDLAERVGLSPTPCQRRVKRLEEEGVIERYAALVSPPALGLVLQAMVQVTLDDHSEKTVEAFEAAIRARPEVVACYAMTGDMDFLLHILVPDLASFSEFAMKALLRMPGVRGTRSSFIMQAVKSELVWSPQPPARVRRSTGRSMLPPLRTRPTRWPARRSRSCRSAASAAAPAPSVSWCVSS
jgi:Lrp/AsnC family leucine-responsive transcriptional regulator